MATPFRVLRRKTVPSYIK
uniref:Uncharacterized protein n=1 Tax=Anguilla anguilla TaxID=7936 RepID=A0A0E9SF70_ANGAN